MTKANLTVRRLSMQINRLRPSFCHLCCIANVGSLNGPTDLLQSAKNLTTAYVQMHFAAQKPSAAMQKDVKDAFRELVRMQNGMDASTNDSGGVASTDGFRN